MKRLLAALAAVALLAFVGCSSATSNSSSGPTVNYSKWQIKGSYDNWTTHKFVVSDLNPNTITFVMDGLYQDSNLPIVYEFVLLDPAGKQYSYNATTNVTPGTPFVLGDSTVTGTAFSNNVKFVAAKASYTVTVDITTATAPSVNLVGSTTAAPASTAALLLSKLQIKGDQFSVINGNTVGAWTGTSGTISGSTESWDIVVNSKIGHFGFNSIDGFLAHVAADVSGLTATTSAATAAVELLNDNNKPATNDPGNVQLANTTKDSNTYTVTVTVDPTKAFGAGRYMMTVSLKALGTSNWAFTPWTNVYIAGNETSWTPGSFATATIAAGVATYHITSAANATVQFKVEGVNDAAGWAAPNLGFSDIAVATGSIALKDVGGNIGFDATVGSSYTITVDFTGTYTTTGTPVVKVVTP